MSYVMMILVEALGFLALFGFYKGIIGIVPAFLFVVVMLALSFHVLAREDRPDATSIRMACFSAALWYGAILSGKLFFEFRSWPVTLAAAAFCILCIVVAAFSSLSVLERPLDYDVEEAE